MVLTLGFFHKCPLSGWRYSLLFLAFLVCWILSNVFSVSTEIPCGFVFILLTWYYINVVVFILNQHCILGLYPSLSWHTILSIHCWICFTSIMLRISVSILIRNIALQFFFLVTSLSGLGSVQFSCSVVSDSLRPHGLQHARLPCPSPTPRACSNSCTSSRWCYSTVSSSVVPFSCLQSFSESGPFPMSQFFASGGQSIGASASVLPMNIQDWFPLGLTGWISLQSKGLSRVFSNTTVQKHHSLALSFLYGPTLTSIHD